MIVRQIEKEVIAAASEYPVLTIIGPRQSGKTTLVKMVFPGHQYVNLESPELRSLALDDPKTLLKRFQPPVILDEIQNVPELLSWIQTIVDENPVQKARFILTGSNQLQLREQVSQSLAGRTALLTLLPFSITELKNYNFTGERADLILKGFMPRVHQESIRPNRAYRDYYQTYIERDVRRLISLEKRIEFEQFIKILAARVGQELNLNSISGQIGVSSPQLKKWLSILEASFIIFRLPPYFKNLGKRITKSPKLYFLDVGLVCYLLGIETAEQVERDPLFGNIFENMIILEAFKNRHNRGKEPSLYFYRDHNQNELDLLFPSGSNFIPIEIKSSRTFNKRFLRGVEYFQKISNTNAKGILIYDGDLEITTDTYSTVNFRNFEKLVSPDLK